MLRDFKTDTSERVVIYCLICKSFLVELVCLEARDMALHLNNEELRYEHREKNGLVWCRGYLQHDRALTFDDTECIYMHVLNLIMRNKLKTHVVM